MSDRENTLVFECHIKWH